MIVVVVVVISRIDEFLSYLVVLWFSTNTAASLGVAVALVEIAHCLFVGCVCYSMVVELFYEGVLVQRLDRFTALAHNPTKSLSGSVCLSSIADWSTNSQSWPPPIVLS